MSGQFEKMVFGKLGAQNLKPQFVLQGHLSSFATFEGPPDLLPVFPDEGARVDDEADSKYGMLSQPQKDFFMLFGYKRHS